MSGLSALRNSVAIGRSLPIGFCNSLAYAGTLFRNDPPRAPKRDLTHVTARYRVALLFRAFGQPRSLRSEAKKTEVFFSARSNDRSLETASPQPNKVRAPSCRKFAEVNKRSLWTSEPLSFGERLLFELT